MKDEVSMRILAHESPKSMLRLKRYVEKSFRDIFVISGKVASAIFGNTFGFQGSGNWSRIEIK
jgi:hypothetical protein